MSNQYTIKEIEQKGESALLFGAAYMILLLTVILTATLAHYF